jgi:UDP-galactopyranose mutase
MPINLGTVNAYYGVNLKPYEVAQFLEDKKGAFARPANLEEKAISLIGEDLYEAFIKGYTAKQWGCDPKELPASIITRLPVRESYNDLYFNDQYQGIPVEGYTPIFERMLDDTPVELGVDFFDDIEYWRARCETLVYTGPIDRFFGYAHGHLNWRSVRFEIEKENVRDYQGTSVMNYAEESIPYTRIHEPKHLHPERTSSNEETVVIREYSHIDENEPYYPVNFPEDKAMLAEYTQMQKTEPRVIFGGRLASYKYYDMHQVIGQALAVARRELK